MFERFTDRARRVLVLAQEESRRFGHRFIGTEHLLLGLLSERDGAAAKALSSLGVTLDGARERVTEAVPPGRRSGDGSPPFTPRMKKVLELSLREALELGHSYIGTEHLLLALVSDEDGVGCQVLLGLGAEAKKVRAAVMRSIRAGSAAGSRRQDADADTEASVLLKALFVSDMIRPPGNLSEEALWERVRQALARAEGEGQDP